MATAGAVVNSDMHAVRCVNVRAPEDFVVGTWGQRVTGTGELN